MSKSLQVVAIVLWYVANKYNLYSEVSEGSDLTEGLLSHKKTYLKCQGFTNTIHSTQCDCKSFVRTLLNNLTLYYGIGSNHIQYLRSHLHQLPSPYLKQCDLTKWHVHDFAQCLYLGPVNLSASLSKSREPLLNSYVACIWSQLTY